MTPRSLMMWTLAGAMLAWIGAVTLETSHCRTTGGQFAIVGWRCVMPRPSVILRRELERT